MDECMDMILCLLGHRRCIERWNFDTIMVMRESEAGGLECLVAFVMERWPVLWVSCSFFEWQMLHHSALKN